MERKIAELANDAEALRGQLEKGEAREEDYQHQVSQLQQEVQGKEHQLKEELKVRNGLEEHIAQETTRMEELLAQKEQLEEQVISDKVYVCSLRFVNQCSSFSLLSFVKICLTRRRKLVTWKKQKDI